MDRREIANILASVGLRPQHKFGQNFMVDQVILQAIVDAGEVRQRDVVLEVGPGVGNLTRLLAQRAKAVLAVDIDRKLLPAAQRYHAGLANVTWMLGDVLAGKHAVEPAVLERLRGMMAEGGTLKLVSNLPYNAASPLVAELLVQMWREMVREKSANALCWERLAFTVQWEVGVRMRAGPGGRGASDYGPLGILIQSMAEVEIVRKIGAGAFWPPPKIQSALVIVQPRVERMRRVRDAESWQKFLAGIFGHRRQTLGNALKHYYGETWNGEAKQLLTDAGIDLMLRPEAFAVEGLLAIEALCQGLVGRISA